MTKQELDFLRDLEILYKRHGMIIDRSVDCSWFIHPLKYPNSGEL